MLRLPVSIPNINASFDVRHFSTSGTTLAEGSRDIWPGVPNDKAASKSVK